MRIELSKKDPAGMKELRCVIQSCLTKVHCRVDQEMIRNHATVLGTHCRWCMHSSNTQLCLASYVVDYSFHIGQEEMLQVGMILRERGLPLPQSQVWSVQRLPNAS